MDKQIKAIDEAKNRAKIFTENGWTEHEVAIFIKGFVEGSEWGIESAYHKPSEKPIDGENLLLDTDLGYIIESPDNNDFDDTVKTLGVNRWAYIKDILPGSTASPKKKNISSKFRTGDLVVLKSYQKCIELNKDYQLNEAALKGLMGRKFKIEDIEIDNGQVFYKLDGGSSTINRFPECFLDYVGNLLQVPKMNAVISKYIEGQLVVIRSEIELRSIFGKDADLTEYIPYAGEVVMIDEIVKEGPRFLYKIRKYHQKEAIYVSEDVILCDANNRPQREPLECRNEIDSIIARDIHVAQLDTSKLNPLPMETWKALFASVESFLSLASPSMRAWAAGQLYGYSESLMQQITETPVEAPDTGKENFNATLFVCLADNVLECPNECGGEEFATGTFRLKEGAYFSKYRIKSSCVVYTSKNIGLLGSYNHKSGLFSLGLTIRQEGFTEEDLKDFLFKFKGRRVVLLYKGDKEAYYSCIFTHDITSSYVNFLLDKSGLRYVSLIAERVFVSEIRLKEEDLNLSELLKD